MIVFTMMDVTLTHNGGERAKKIPAWKWMRLFSLCIEKGWDLEVVYNHSKKWGAWYFVNPRTQFMIRLGFTTE